MVVILVERHHARTDDEDLGGKVEGINRGDLRWVSTWVLLYRLPRVHCPIYMLGMILSFFLLILLMFLEYGYVNQDWLGPQNVL